MKRATCFIVCLMMPACVPAAWGQTNGLNYAAASTLTSALAATTTQPASDLGDVVKQELRNTLAQLFVGFLQNFFDDFRTTMGLTADAANPATDFLGILELMIENVVLASANQ